MQRYLLLVLLLVFVWSLSSGLIFSQETGCILMESLSREDSVKIIDLPSSTKNLIARVGALSDELKILETEFKTFKTTCNNSISATLSALTEEREAHNDALKNVLALERLIEQQKVTMIVGGSILGATTVASVIIAIVLGMQQ